MTIRKDPITTGVTLPDPGLTVREARALARTAGMLLAVLGLYTMAELGGPVALMGAGGIESPLDTDGGLNLDGREV